MVMVPVAGRPSSENSTKSWRVQRPEVDYSKCIRCMICWKFCPDDAIQITDRTGIDSPSERISKMVAPVIDYEHCKGCGICAYECPEDCIEMEMEGGISL